MGSARLKALAVTAALMLATPALGSDEPESTTTDARHQRDEHPAAADQPASPATLSILGALGLGVLGLLWVRRHTNEL